MNRLGRLIRTTIVTGAIIMASAPMARGQEGPKHKLSVELRPAYNLISHGYFNGRNPDNKTIDKCASIHLRYAFEHSPSSRIGGLYPAVYQGIGLATYTFFSDCSVGTPLALYIFQGARLHDFRGRGPSVGYEWNLGYSWGWKPNSAMNSRWNVLINIGIPIGWQMEGGWELSLTPDFTHFSNGDTSFPNAGTNTFGLRIGALKEFGPNLRQRVDIKRLVEPSAELVGNTAHRLVWDLIGYGGWRADRFASNDRLCVVDSPLVNGGLMLSPLYKLNRYVSLGGSLDLLVDTSANLYDAVWQDDMLVGYMRPPLWQQTSLGVSLRGELRMGHMAVGIGSGVNLITHGYDMRRYYTSFTLKGFVSEQAFLFVGYRLSSLQYTHNIMYGVGVRF